MLCVWPLLLPLQLLLARTAPADCAAAPPTYDVVDQSTGRTLRCDACPPGTFLLSRCTSEAGSVCARCPAGSYTEVWNYIGRCLRCGVCARNQAVKKQCSRDSDCQCECKQGYYYNGDRDTCVPHSDCPPGRGVLSKGTPEKDTVCHICSSGTYSDVSSAHHNCTAHKNCSDAGLQEMLRGSTWHDSVCANCADLQDGAYYLKEIIPAFFVNHKMNLKKLRRFVHILPSDGGKKQDATSHLHFSELYARINSWVSAATATEIRQLPAVLEKVRSDIANERLKNMLKAIDKSLTEQCRLVR